MSNVQADTPTPSRLIFPFFVSPLKLALKNILELETEQAKIIEKKEQSRSEHANFKI
jgi:hypothetical protein